MRSTRSSPLQILPIALLVVAISIHGFRIEVRDEDPQRGSAFAMFSTVDFRATRRVLATVPGDNAITLTIPDTLTTARTRLLDAPSEDDARSLGNLLLDLAWDVEGQTATVGERVTFEEVRVQVVGLDADGRTLSARTITDAVVKNPGS